MICFEEEVFRMITCEIEALLSKVQQVFEMALLDLKEASGLIFSNVKEDTIRL